MSSQVSFSIRGRNPDVLTCIANLSTFVPTQDWNRKWTDEDLYAKYDISASEIAFIEKVIRPMDLSGASDE